MGQSAPSESAAPSTASGALLRGAAGSRPLAAPNRSEMGAQAGPFGADIAAAACQARKPCHVIESQDAGHDAEGRRLSVVKVALFDGPGVGDDPRRFEGECDKFGYWVLVAPAAGPSAAHLLLELCNDGYGASGIGEDTIEVGDNSFKHAQVGGSSWRGESDVELSLSPLVVLEEESAGYHTLGLDFSRQSFSWPTFWGRQAWFTPVCDSEASTLGDDVDLQGDLYASAPYAHGWIDIPQVTLDEAFVREPNTNRLGDCAPNISGAALDGFLLRGNEGQESDASFKVVANASGSTLYLELRDDVVTTRDQLALWLGDGEPWREEGSCMSKPTGKPSEWLLDASGKVRPGRGPHPVPGPRTQVARGIDGSQRFVIELPEHFGKLTLAYTDADGGANPERVFASSKLRVDDLYSLGALHPIAPTRATCWLRGGKLAPDLMPYQP